MSYFTLILLTFVSSIANAQNCGRLSHADVQSIISKSEPFPWTAQVYKEGDDEKPICMAALIEHPKDNVIVGVTLESCVREGQGLRVAVGLAVGRTNVSQPTYLTVEQVQVDQTSMSLDKPALLFFKESIESSASVMPLCAPKRRLLPDHCYLTASKEEQKKFSHYNVELDNILPCHNGILREINEHTGVCSLKPITNDVQLKGGSLSCLIDGTVYLYGLYVDEKVARANAGLGSEKRAIYSELFTGNLMEGVQDADAPLNQNDRQIGSFFRLRLSQIANYRLTSLYPEMNVTVLDDVERITLPIVNLITIDHNGSRIECAGTLISPQMFVVSTSCLRSPKMTSYVALIDSHNGKERVLIPVTHFSTLGMQGPLKFLFGLLAKRLRIREQPMLSMKDTFESGARCRLYGLDNAASAKIAKAVVVEQEQCQVEYGDKFKPGSMICAKRLEDKFKMLIGTPLVCGSMIGNLVAGINIVRPGRFHDNLYIFRKV